MKEKSFFCPCRFRLAVFFGLLSCVMVSPVLADDWLPQSPLLPRGRACYNGICYIQAPEQILPVSDFLQPEGNSEKAPRESGVPRESVATEEGELALREGTVTKEEFGQLKGNSVDLENKENEKQESINKQNDAIQIILFALAAFLLLKDIFKKDKTSIGNNSGIVVIPSLDPEVTGGDDTLVLPPDPIDPLMPLPIIKDAYPTVGNKGIDQTFYTAVPTLSKELESVRKLIIQYPENTFGVIGALTVPRYATSPDANFTVFYRRLFATQAMAEGTAVAISGLTAVKKLNDRTLPSDTEGIFEGEQDAGRAKNQRSLPEGLEMIAKAARLRLLATEQIQFAVDMSQTESTGTIYGEPFKSKTRPSSGSAADNNLSDTGNSNRNDTDNNHRSDEDDVPPIDSVCDDTCQKNICYANCVKAACADDCAECPDDKDHCNDDEKNCDMGCARATCTATCGIIEAAAGSQ